MFEIGDFYFIAIGLFFNMLVGMLWYSPALFQDVFIKENALDPRRLHPKLYIIVGMITFELMEVIGIFAALKTTGALGDLYESMKIAFFLWQFLIFPSMTIHRLFDGKSVKLTMVYATHHLASMLLEAFFMSYFY